MSYCTYCTSAINEDDLGWCYFIIPETEDVIYAHDECLEISEGVTLLEPIFDSSTDIP